MCQPLASILARLAMVQRRVDLAATKRLNYHCALRRAENGPDDRHREGEDRRGRAATSELHHWQLEARLRHYLEVEQGSREYIASSLALLDERSYVTLLDDRGKRTTLRPPSLPFTFSPPFRCALVVDTRCFFPGIIWKGKRDFERTRGRFLIK